MLLRIFKIDSENLQCETELPLPSTTVSFAQCPTHAVEMHTLDVFQITILTSNGNIHTICPILLKEMFFKEDHFSSILIQLEDLIS